MISTQRANELVAIYNDLKKRILAIDDKYSLDYHEPVLDLPPTLGLQKMTFKGKTEDEIRALAMEKSLPIFNSKTLAIGVWYENRRNAVALKREKLTEKQRVTEKQLKDDFEKNYADMYAKLARNGLLFSTIREKKLLQTKTDYDNQIDELRKSIQAEADILDNEEKGYATLHSKRISSTNTYRNALINNYITQINEELKKEKERADKYNQQVDEKERRYKVTLERLKETARKNEYDRVYKMTKLYAEIGETGMKNRKLTEKLEVSKQCFLSLTKEEGQFILSLDSFLRSHLDTYYSTFTTWVNNTLK